MEIRIHNLPDNSNLTASQIRRICVWLAGHLNLPVQSIDVVFTDDVDMRSLHKQFLSDPNYTDVMVFNLGDAKNIESEIYISSERAIENAQKYNVSFECEITRLILHACLHLAGFQDNAGNLKRKMKREEDNLLEILSQKFLN